MSHAGRRAARRDSNESVIVDALLTVGARVRRLASAGVPDLLVGFRGSLWLLEVKDPTKPAADQRLKPAQAVFFEEYHGYPVAVVKSIDEALRVIGALNVRMG